MLAGPESLSPQTFTRWHATGEGLRKKRSAFGALPRARQQGNQALPKTRVPDFVACTRLNRGAKESIPRHFPRTAAQCGNNGLRGLRHELEFGVDRDELPALGNPHLRLLDAECVDAGRDANPLAAR